MQKGGCGSQGDKKYRKDKRLSIPNTQITIPIHKYLYIRNPKATESQHKSRAITFLKYKIIYSVYQTI